MGPRSKPCLHYEGAFEDYLRRRGLPYVAVDESRQALFAGAKLKSFDFVVYRPEGRNLLVDVKGRICRPPRPGRSTSATGPRQPALQNWATRKDIDDLRQWEEIFGGGFQAVFVFAYFWTEEPETAPFGDLFSFQNRWYAMLTISISAYREHMRARSEAWGTVHLPTADFRRLAKPFEEWL